MSDHFPDKFVADNLPEKLADNTLDSCLADNTLDKWSNRYWPNCSPQEHFCCQSWYYSRCFWFTASLWIILYSCLSWLMWPFVCLWHCLCLSLKDGSFPERCALCNLCCFLYYLSLSSLVLTCERWIHFLGLWLQVQVLVCFRFLLLVSLLLFLVAITKHGITLGDSQIRIFFCQAQVVLLCSQRSFCQMHLWSLYYCCHLINGFGTPS